MKFRRINQTNVNCRWSWSRCPDWNAWWARQNDEFPAERRVAFTPFYRAHDEIIAAFVAGADTIVCIVSQVCFLMQEDAEFGIKFIPKHVYKWDHRHRHKPRLQWQGPKSKKAAFFVVPFTLPEKPITFGVLARKVHAWKNPNLILVRWYSGGHRPGLNLSTFDRTYFVRITSRAAVGCM